LVVYIYDIAPHLTHILNKLTCSFHIPKNKHNKPILQHFFINLGYNHGNRTEHGDFVHDNGDDGNHVLRADLYCRLAVFPLATKSLADRSQDIHALAAMLILRRAGNRTVIF